MRGGAVAIVGGSIAGCAAALAAHRCSAGAIAVFERAGKELRDRGVGIGVHEARFAELEAAGYVDSAAPWVRLTRRVWTVRDGAAERGRDIGSQPFPFRGYNWGSLWTELRRRVPDTVDYRTDATVTGVEPDADGVTVQLADGGSEHFDAVIGADGYRSVVRTSMFPGLAPAYAGYVGWRGTLDDVPAPGPDGDDAHVVGFPGGHCMLYVIPGPGGSHRLNWVLYATPPPEFELDLRTPTSLPPGRVASALTQYLRSLVAEHFPPYWADRILGTPPESTFLQPIYDLEVPRYAAGRLLLVGDAATVARPHTGGGTVKALQDATALENAGASGSDWTEIAAAYDADRTAVGTQVVALGRRLGRAQVEKAPDWAAMHEADLQAWWAEQNQGSDQRSGFGGHAMNRS
ncbi:monooxygenase [Streptomyces sp. A7024]|uniref:Monooxygenase n=1 Tax=Streptomyces coryli TaxID=1128680 RepID=A0A6G4U1P2_9ACTN|nr:FAD-dependent monooxygenase [Streptomyces coryli]NGN65298.1 monooxygenase [Streptomyces coryli]